MRVHCLFLIVAAGAAMTAGSAWADGSHPCPHAAAATTGPATTTAQTPNPSNRQYSYQPGTRAASAAPRTASSAAPRRYRSYSYAPAGTMGYRNYNRGYSLGQRDAGSKARGDYTPYRGGNYIP